MTHSQTDYTPVETPFAPDTEVARLGVCTSKDLENTLFENLKIDVSQYSRVAIDAEWIWSFIISEILGFGRKQRETRGRKAEFISVQFAFSDELGRVQKIVVFKDPKYPTPQNTVVDGHDVLIVDCDKLGFVNLLERFVLGKELTILMFYSPKDLEATIGVDKWREMLLTTIGGRKCVEKRRRLNVRKFMVGKCAVSVRDLIGMFNSSLDNAFRSVGIDNPYKGYAEKEVIRNGVLVKRDKGDIGAFAMEDARENLEYIVGDVLFLHQTMLLNIRQTNDILEKAFGFKDVYTSESIKLTSGSLVADVFEQWLIRRYPDLFESVLMLSSSNSNKDWGKLKQIAKEIESGAVDLDGLNKRVKNLDTSVHGLAAGSIRAFYPGNYGTGTISYNAVVQGGRCVNEKPYKNKIDKAVLDIDLASCYGSALNKFDYPFGLPTVYCKNLDNEVVTLGAFLASHEADLVDGLYQIYVDGVLPFNQDLIHSKYNLDTNKLGTKLHGSDWSEFESDNNDESFGWEHEIETAHMGGDFLLTTKQIEKGIIQADNLKVIREVSTDLELSGWMNLTVVAASWYPKSKEVTVEEFTFICHTKKLRGSKFGHVDTRTKNWTRLPLTEFIGNFLKVIKA